jgi:hypothetical protein
MATETERLNYILSNPDLRENAEAAGLTRSEMLTMADWHWNNYGINENRENTPDKVSNTGGYTETLTAAHYQDRPVEATLQASVRAADPSDMWDARAAISDKWNLDQFTAEGWNLDPDDPYRTGIRGDTLAVNTGIGQLVPTAAGDQKFLQDRYYDDYISRDFPVGWTTPEGEWAAAAPQQLGNYWDVLTNAVREDGVLKRLDPYNESTAVGPSVDPGDRGGGNVRPDGTTTSTTDTTTGRVESGAAGAENLLAYRPWTKNYWNEYIPKKSEGLLYMNKPQRDYGLAYLPGEHRDPVTWGKWADDHKGHIPGGGWRFSPESYTIQTNPATGQPYAAGTQPRAPWRFTSGPASATNIYNNPWNATSMNLTPAQGTQWQGFLSGLGQTPAVDTSTATLLGV